MLGTPKGNQHFMLVYLILGLILFGGARVSLPSGHLELAQIDLFAFALLILLGMDIRRGSKSESLRAWDIRIEKYVLRPIQEKKLWIGLAVVGTVLLLVHLVRDLTLQTHMFDNSCLHQPLFYPFEPQFFHCNACRMDTQFAEHILWPLVVLAPLTSLLKSDLFIFILQILFVLGPLAFYITRGPLQERSRLWILAAFVVLCSSPLRHSLFRDFREDHLIFGAFLMAGWALQTKRPWHYLSFLLLGILSKENAPVVGFFFLFPILFDKNLPLSKLQRQRLAGATAFLTLAYTALLVKVIIPNFMGSSESENNILRAYPGMGSTMSEFAINVLKNPFAFMSLVADPLLNLSSLKYVFRLLTPFLLLFLCGRWWLVPALPGIFMNLSAVGFSREVQRMQIFHYELIILPFLVLGMVQSLAWSRKWDFQRPRFAFLVLAVALCAFGRSPVYYMTSWLAEFGYRIPGALALDRLRLEEPLAASPYLWPQLNHLKELRYIDIPSDLGGDPTEKIKRFLSQNPPRPLTGQGRDPGDSRLYLLQLDIPGTEAFRQELLRIGGSEIWKHSDTRGRPFLSLIQTPQPVFSIWCEQMNLCRTP